MTDRRPATPDTRLRPLSRPRCAAGGFPQLPPTKPSTPPRTAHQRPLTAVGDDPRWEQRRQGATTGQYPGSPYRQTVSYTELQATGQDHHMNRSHPRQKASRPPPPSQPPQVRRHQIPAVAARETVNNAENGAPAASQRHPGAPAEPGSANAATRPSVHPYPNR